MAKKQNPLLAAFEAKKEKEFQGRLACNTELNMIAVLIAGNDLGFLAEKKSRPASGPTGRGEDGDRRRPGQRRQGRR